MRRCPTAECGVAPQTAGADSGMLMAVIPAEAMQSYGYGAVAVGAMLEGELMVLAGGCLAAAGQLSFPGVMLAGLAGVLCCDSAAFLLGRYAGHRIGRWFPPLFADLRRVQPLMDEYRDLLAAFFPFCPGLSPAAPVAFGMSRIGLPRFLALDLLGNATWSLVFASLGWIAGQGARHLLRSLTPAAGVALLGALGAFVAFRFCRRLRQPKHNNTRWSAPRTGALHSG